MCFGHPPLYALSPSGGRDPPEGRERASRATGRKPADFPVFLASARRRPAVRGSDDGAAPVRPTSRRASVPPIA